MPVQKCLETYRMHHVNNKVKLKNNQTKIEKKQKHLRVNQSQILQKNLLS